jgi:hypothetical protein
MKLCTAFDKFKILITAIFCLTGFFYSPLVEAQQNTPANIKKIILQDTGSDLIYFNETRVEIVNEQGHWNSYQISQVTEMGNQKERDSVRKYIVTLEAGAIGKFLHSLTILKPAFNWREFGITPATMRADLQAGNKETIPGFEKVVNEQTIAKAINDMGTMIRFTDDKSYCSIKIVDNREDTTTIKSGFQTLCMLPWRFNNHQTFNMGITAFSY